MRQPHQHPDSGSKIFPEMTFIKHYVLTRNAVQLLQADTQFADMPNLPAEEDDDLPAFDHGQVDDPDRGVGLADHGEHGGVILGHQGEEAEEEAEEEEEEQAAEQVIGANPLLESMGGGGRRQANDPAPDSMHPRMNGAGNKFSTRSRSLRHTDAAVLGSIQSKGLQLLQAEGLGDGIDPHAKKGHLHTQCLLFQFRSCRLSPTCILSSFNRDRQVEESRRLDDSMNSASSFALVELPPELEDMRWQEEDTLVPARIIFYAGLVWSSEVGLQRLAYVKLLPYVREEVCIGSGQYNYSVEDREVRHLEGGHRVVCLPLGSIKHPLVVIEPDPAAELQTWDLVEYQGKKFGLINRTEVDPQYLHHVAVAP